MPSLSELIRNFDPAREFDPPPSWLQGRTLYGGLSAALMLQTVLSAPNTVLPPLKSALVSFVGPAAGPLRFQSRILRQGKSATSASADVLAEGKVCVSAALLFATPRSSRVRHEHSPRPDVPPPEACEPLQAGDKAPASLGNFEVRPATTSLPGAAASYPEVTAWARHVDASGVDPAVALLALGDALPPASLTVLDDLVPVSSMTWTVDLARPANRAQSGEWHLLRSTSRHASDGYSFQAMEAWDRNGALVLSGSQTVAIFDVPR